jgi:hypothetical protein
VGPASRPSGAAGVPPAVFGLLGTSALDSDQNYSSPSSSANAKAGPEAQAEGTSGIRRAATDQRGAILLGHLGPALSQESFVTIKRAQEGSFVNAHQPNYFSTTPFDFVAMAVRHRLKEVSNRTSIGCQHQSCFDLLCHPGLPSRQKIEAIP